MTFPEFDKFFDDFVAECRKMRDTKGKEYAIGADRFANFNDEARDNNVDRLLVAQIFFNKHFRAIRTYIQTGQTHSNESIRGRFVDAVTYLILMAGMAEEKNIQENDKVETRITQPFKVNDNVRCLQTNRVGRIIQLDDTREYPIYVEYSNSRLWEYSGNLVHVTNV